MNNATYTFHFSIPHIQVIKYLNFDTIVENPFEFFSYVNMTILRQEFNKGKVQQSNKPAGSCTLEKFIEPHSM